MPMTAGASAASVSNSPRASSIKPGYYRARSRFGLVNDPPGNSIGSEQL